jgi:hypothetical protein
MILKISKNRVSASIDQSSSIAGHASQSTSSALPSEAPTLFTTQASLNSEMLPSMPDIRSEIDNTLPLPLGLVRIQGLSIPYEFVLLKETGDVLCMTHNRLMEFERVKGHCSKVHKGDQRHISNDDLQRIAVGRSKLYTENREEYYHNFGARGPLPCIEIHDGFECDSCGVISKSLEGMRKHFSACLGEKKSTACKYQEIMKEGSIKPLKLKCNVSAPVAQPVTPLADPLRAFQAFQDLTRLHRYITLF